MLQLSPAQPSCQKLYSSFKLLMGCGTDDAYTQPNKQQQQHVLTATGNKPNQIIIRGQCEEKDATFFVDTGSSVSLLIFQTWRKIHYKLLSGSGDHSRMTRNVSNLFFIILENKFVVRQMYCS